MNKKIIISSIVILIVVVVAGGFFWWRQGREIKGSPEDYVIMETAEGIFVENKKAGLSVKVPEGWEVEKMEMQEGLIVFYSPNVEGEIRDDKVVPPLREGCIIHVSVIYEGKDITQLKLEARYNLALLGVKSAEFEEVMINNYEALKIIADTEKIGPGVGVDISHKDKTYSFLLIFTPEERGVCIQEFDKFLETISIK